jgi:hypothetical protein
MYFSIVLRFVERGNSRIVSFYLHFKDTARKRNSLLWLGGFLKISCNVAVEIAFCFIAEEGNENMAASC